MEGFDRFMLIVCGSHFWCRYRGLREFTGEISQEMNDSLLSSLQEENDRARLKRRMLRRLKHALRDGEEQRLLEALREVQDASGQYPWFDDSITECADGAVLLRRFRSNYSLDQLDALEQEAQAEIHQGFANKDHFSVDEPGFSWVLHPNTVICPGDETTARGAGADGLRSLAGPKPFVRLANQCLSTRPRDRKGCWSLLSMLDGEFDSKEGWNCDGPAFSLGTRPGSANPREIRRAARQIVTEMAAASGDAVLKALPYAIARRVRSLYPHWMKGVTTSVGARAV